MVFIPKHNKAPKIARKSKYGNKRVEYMKIMFDSIGERDRYIFLKDQERRGLIRNLRTQVSFDLKVNDQLICRYIADFVYEVNPTGVNGQPLQFGDGHFTTIEDFKGVSTAIFKLKAKLMLACHDIEVKVVKSPTAMI